MDKLSPADRALFDISMATEWENWKTFEAVELILPQDVPEGTKIIGTRWVHTDKNMQAKQVGRKVPTKAKSRLVVQGHQEYVSFRCDSPTASLLFVNVLCSMAATYDWKIKAADAASAYLQSDGIKSFLYSGHHGQCQIQVYVVTSCERRVRSTGPRMQGEVGG